jgi:hypothetical protein
MKYKIAQGFIIQVIDDSDKVISTSFIPGDKFSIDEGHNLIDNGIQKFPLIKDGVSYSNTPPKQNTPYTPVPPSENDSSLNHNDDMPFGKHKGTKIGALPIEYINWGAENMTHQEMKNTFIKEQARRKNGGELVSGNKKGFVGFDDEGNKSEAELANKEIDDTIPF